MPTETRQIPWGPVRAVLEENFSFGRVKSIVAAAGFDMGELAAAHNEVALMGTLDRLYAEMEAELQARFLAIIVEEILTRAQDRQREIDERLGYVLSRMGWSLLQGRVVPIEVIDRTELEEVPSEARDDFVKASTRLRDGDLSGAVSAACGAVDSVTRNVYQTKMQGQACLFAIRDFRRQYAAIEG